MKSGKYKDATITALGHDGFIVDYPERPLRFAFDPFDINGEEPVDYILVSHLHYDHCDPASIRKLLKPTTKIIAPPCCKNELAEFADQIEFASDKDKQSTKDFTYWTVPAYNLNKYRTPTEVFHPKELGGVGFVVELDSTTGGTKTRYFHAGDTDNIPEMAELKKIDVAFLPISGTFVMTLDEAMQAAEVIQPKVVVPMHFGKLLGSVAEATRFQNLLQNKVPVMVLSTVEY